MGGSEPGEQGVERSIEIYSPREWHVINKQFDTSTLNISVLGAASYCTLMISGSVIHRWGNGRITMLHDMSTYGAGVCPLLIRTD